MKILLTIIVVIITLSSCATASFSKYKSMGRVKKYDFYSYDLPKEFDGFRILFASDFHYESKFSRKRLLRLVDEVNKISPDVMLLGGDYIGRNGGNMDTLFHELSKIKTSYGIYAVMGNHDIGSHYSEIVSAMKSANVSIMENNSYVITQDSAHIIVTGVKNPFDLENNRFSPSETFSSKDFIVLVSHTPDYAEDVDVSNAYLILSGHTHGGQISFFKKFTPARRFSKYGSRFLTGFKENSKGTPIIITNGLGTSRKDFRLFTPSEVVLITLRRLEKE